MKVCSATLNNTEMYRTNNTEGARGGRSGKAEDLRHKREIKTRESVWWVESSAKVKR